MFAHTHTHPHAHTHTCTHARTRTHAHTHTHTHTHPEDVGDEVNPAEVLHITSLVILSIFMVEVSWST